MRTEFTLAQLADPDTAASEKILRACVHCGFCTATCPTYVLLGDELDSPRGRIYLIKNMLEGSEPIGVETVKHIDRCLSCLACMTTCPSGVNYMHLVDHGRRHIEAHYRRPWAERLLRYSLDRVLTRPRAEVVVAPGSGCCGALTHHLGDEEPALAFARANIDAWEKARATGGLDAIVANASGCGTMLKHYGFLLRTDPAYAAKAAQIAGLARDVSEVITELGLRNSGNIPELRVAYHSACSLQHGQRIDREPKALLAAAGFAVVDVPEGHLCCGSAGTYNLLQPELASALRDRKLANIALTRADLVSAGHLGCITQLAGDAPVPVAHTVELLDWATGGPMPAALAGRGASAAAPAERRERAPAR